ncbi:related to TMA20-protein putative involved in cytoplasmic ribosome function [Serendipita indica DSM 11827]|uniref:Translation machinery-associated protein 20 n=1 Tax=Serendipita indica (strain DSM 11827) TaxID=1109443 RepID=G4T6I5_SERID|nr:related to TMA20-protein putative involved in cytoplasmic ribosome function [Serendipita indica DSM 11827]
MFKKFSPSTDIAGQAILKQSAQRTIRANLLDQWKGLTPETLDASIWSKKESLVLVKGRDHLSIYTVQGRPLFFQHFDGPLIPTLRLLHQFPKILPALRVDRGAIRFLLQGANMMAPGFTSKGGWLPDASEAIPAGTVVAIETEGKEHAAAIGITKLSTEDMKAINKGVAVEILCYLGDDLWSLQTI